MVTATNTMTNLEVARTIVFILSEAIRENGHDPSKMHLGEMIENVQKLDDVE